MYNFTHTNTYTYIHKIHMYIHIYVHTYIHNTHMHTKQHIYSCTDVHMYTHTGGRRKEREGAEERHRSPQ